MASVPRDNQNSHGQADLQPDIIGPGMRTGMNQRFPGSHSN